MTGGVPATVVVDSYENQRWYPWGGWRGKLLPTDRPHYSSRDGREDRRRTAVPLRSGYVWENDWCLIVCVASVSDSAEMTDKDGWMYAVDFPSASWAASAGFGCCVRRRRFQRTMVRRDASVQAKDVVDETQHDTCNGESPRCSADGAQANDDEGREEAVAASNPRGTERVPWQQVNESFELPEAFVLQGQRDGMRRAESGAHYGKQGDETVDEASFLAAYESFLSKARAEVQSARQ